MVLRVSGRIQAEHVDMLRDLLGREEGRATIDLKEVLLITLEAVKFLALSEASGMELRNCTSYIREWVDQERIRNGAGPSDLEAGARGDVEGI